MNDFSAVTGLSLMALASAIGFFTSWLPQLRRWVLLALVSVFLMLPLSALLRSITLGWLFGLSLMFLLPVFLLFNIGAVLGHWLSEKNTKNDIESGKVEAPAHESMPGVHRVASLLQRWMMGTHHGAVQPGQLDNYLDEYVFRFNRRTSKSRGLLFYCLLQQAVVTKPVTYQKVAEKRGNSGN